MPAGAWALAGIVLWFVSLGSLAAISPAESIAAAVAGVLAALVAGLSRRALAWIGERAGRRRTLPSAVWRTLPGLPITVVTDTGRILARAARGGLTGETRVLDLAAAENGSAAGAGSASEAGSVAEAGRAAGSGGVAESSSDAARRAVTALLLMLLAQEFRQPSYLVVPFVVVPLSVAGTFVGVDRVTSPAIGTLRRVHSGHVGDYVAWLISGVAALGAAFGLAAR